jgi:hypothetical protein
MNNRHNFDSIIQNQKNFNVVSNNKNQFESIISNQHFFEIIFSGSFIQGEVWNANFEQTINLETNIIVTNYGRVEISSSFSSVINPVLIQYLNIVTSASCSMELIIDSLINMPSMELYLSSNIEGILSQNIKINSIETMIETSYMEFVPEYRHYFLLNNYTGSMLDVLDSMLLQDMDYELV